MYLTRDFFFLICGKISSSPPLDQFFFFQHFGKRRCSSVAFCNYTKIHLALLTSFPCNSPQFLSGSSHFGRSCILPGSDCPYDYLALVLRSIEKQQISLRAAINLIARVWYFTRTYKPRPTSYFLHK